MSVLPGILAAGTSFALAWTLLARRARFPWHPPSRRPDESRPDGELRTVEFEAIDGTRLEGWLFLPHRQQPAPLVVMAPGLTGTKEGHLERFAWRFVREGLAVLLFDFRGFGGSAGAPRHLVDPRRQREDYQAALGLARGPLATAGLVDPERLALWGTSFSGGTVLQLAAVDPALAAVVAQAPFLETPRHLRPTGLALARFVFWATLDMMRVLPPIYVPVFGRPGEWAFAPSRENPSVRDPTDRRAAPFWRTLPRPARGGWENRMLARVLASVDAHRPAEAAPRVRCPTLLVAAARDDLVPLEVVERAHRQIGSPRKQILVLDCGHFELYTGDLALANRARQAEFLAAQLEGTATV